MAVAGGPNIVEDGLVLYLDAGNYDSFLQGEPTVNLNREYYNFTGSNYSPDNEWSGTTLLKEWYPDIETPIGTGATLITESTSSGYQTLSRMGGGGEDGLRSISAYIYPISCSRMEIGMIGESVNQVAFNFTNQTIIYGSGISNRNAIFEQVKGYPGWYRIGANIEGRPGGWVGSLGFDTLNTAVAVTSESAQRVYVTGLQYEYKPYPTPFVAGERAIWNDASRNGNDATLVNNPTFNRDGVQTYFGFDGTNDISTFDLIPAISSSNAYSVCLLLNPNDASTEKGVWLNTNSNTDRHGGKVRGNLFIFKSQDVSLSIPINTNQWQYICCVWDGSNAYLYSNGIENSTDVTSNGSYHYFGYDLSIGKLGGGNTNAGNTYFNGNISLFQVYNRPLSNFEVTLNYSGIKARFGL